MLNKKKYYQKNFTFKIENLKIKKPIVKKKIRLGRGQGSGKGGTCGRGHKGAKSRSGFSKKIGFEGGQMPIHKRIPKFGFNKIKKKNKTIIINLDTIQRLIDIGKIKEKDVISKKTFLKNTKCNKRIFLKILGRGTIKQKIKILANKFSKKSFDSINAVNGITSLE